MRLFLLALCSAVFFFANVVAVAAESQTPNPFPYPGVSGKPWYENEDNKPDVSEEELLQPRVHTGDETGEIAADQDFELCGKTFVSIELAYREITRDLTMVLSDEDERYEYYDDYEKGITWVFTKKEFEAHPSIICKETIIQDGKTLKGITMYCGAKKETCDRFQDALDDGF